jgi:phosphoglycerate dehydrogenase-like enzyme
VTSTRDSISRNGSLEESNMRVADLSSADLDTLADAEVVLVPPRYGSTLRDVWNAMKSVRWIHALGAGVETLPFDLLRQRKDIIVTNSKGIYGDALAEFVIAAILWFAKDLRRLVKNQEAHLWEPYTIQRVEGATLGIFGFGGIGRAVAKRAGAMGMRIVTDRDIDALLETDYLVLSVPLTKETRGILNAERIARMKGVLINVSRGAVVDEEALVDALLNRRMRGAALDVFATEPLPPSHPLWALENVLISPHTADHTSDSHERARNFFLQNLERFRRGEPLQNIVDVEREY